MNIPRIVLTQPSHTAAWDTPSGRYYLIKDQSEQRGTAYARVDLGEEFLASVVSERETILQVHQSCSMKGAAEKYHNPSSPGFKQLLKRMGRGGEQPIYRGPELLHYVHGHGLATFLLAHVAAKNQLQKLKTQARDRTFDFWQVVHFTNGNLSRGAVRFYSPLLKFSELTWNNYHSVDMQSREFKNASYRSEPYPLPQPIKAAVAQFNRAVDQLDRAGFRFNRRQLENLIQQANDGDYGIDDILTASDFH